MTTFIAGGAATYIARIEAAAAVQLAELEKKLDASTSAGQREAILLEIEDVKRNLNEHRKSAAMSLF